MIGLLYNQNRLNKRPIGWDIAFSWYWFMSYICAKFIGNEPHRRAEVAGDVTGHHARY